MATIRSSLTWIFEPSLGNHANHFEGIGIAFKLASHKFDAFL